MTWVIAVTYSEIKAMVKEIGLPSAYNHYAEGESPDPPYVLFLLPSTDDFMADGRNYSGITEVVIELYTDKKYPPLEKRVEDVLTAHEQPWDKSETWIQSEKLYEVRYEFDVLYEYDESDEDDDTTN